WVRSEALDCSGVNVHLYRSPNFQSPPWSPDDEAALARQFEDSFKRPGALVGSRFHVPPGGNDVLAFLDVIASESITRDQLEELLAARPVELKAGETLIWARAGAAARFQASESMADVTKTVFGELKKGMVALFKDGHGEGPLRIQVEATPEGSIYSLDPESVSRLVRIHGADWTGPRVNVDDAVAHDFKSAHGKDVRDHLVAVLTGLDEVYVRNLGGVQFVDHAGRVLRRWPQADGGNNGAGG